MGLWPRPTQADPQQFTVDMDMPDKTLCGDMSMNAQDLFHEELLTNATFVGPTQQGRGRTWCGWTAAWPP